MKHFTLFLCNNCCMNAPQCYVIRTLRVLTANPLFAYSTFDFISLSSYKIRNCRIKRLSPDLWNLSPRLEQRTLDGYKFHDLYSITMRVTRSIMSEQMEIQNAREGNKCVRQFIQNPCFLEINQET
jgi:hypothetical protein